MNSTGSVKMDLGSGLDLGLAAEVDNAVDEFVNPTHLLGGMVSVLFGQFVKALSLENFALHFVLHALGCEAGSIGLQNLDRSLCVHNVYAFIGLYRSRCKDTTIILYRKRYF